MERARRSAMVVGLLVLPVALLSAPAVARQLANAVPVAPRGSVWVAHSPQLHHSVPVHVSGTVQASLSPGVSVPINVSLVNHNSRAVNIRRVRVTITTIVAPRADAAHPCTRLDFEVRQMPRVMLRVAAARSVDLAGLGLGVESWPQLAMRNRLLNQDGCKGAQLTLDYHVFEPRGVTAQ